MASKSDYKYTSFCECGSIEGISIKEDIRYIRGLKCCGCGKEYPDVILDKGDPFKEAMEYELNENSRKFKENARKRGIIN